MVSAIFFSFLFLKQEEFIPMSVTKQQTTQNRAGQYLPATPTSSNSQQKHPAKPNFPTAGK
jgi:hypothetical protein